MSGAVAGVNRYGSIAAEIYDIDKPVGALADTAFHLERLSGVTGAVLEPACGSGRTLLPLLEAGFDACGFEPSPEMLERCRTLCAGAGYRPDLRAARFEDFAYERRFAAILVPVGSFTLIDDFAVAMDVLRRFRDHLEPGGRLTLDIQGLAYLRGGRDDRRRWTAPGGDLLTIEGVRTQVDWLRQRAETVYRYERWRDQTLIETQIDIMSQRYWGPEEFALALGAAGFADIRVMGGYRARPARSDDTTWTFEARKAG